LRLERELAELRGRLSQLERQPSSLALGAGRVSPVPQSTHLGCWGGSQVSSAPLRGSGCLPRPSVQQEGLKAGAIQATSLRQCLVARDCIHLAAACSSLSRKLFSLSASRCSSGWRSSGLRLQSLPSRSPGSLSPLSNGGAGGSLTGLRRQASPARPHPVVPANLTGLALPTPGPCRRSLTSG
jgi:hypothetical protein